MGTHLRVLHESCPMDTNMTGFKCFSKIFVFFVLRTKVATSLKGLRVSQEVMAFSQHYAGELLSISMSIW